MKKIFLTGLFSLLFSVCFSQDKKTIYFLADTVNAPKGNKNLEMLWAMPFLYSFIIHTDFKAPYYKHIEFSTLVDKKNPRAKVETTKPDYPYISREELLVLFKEHPKYFNDFYELHITEVKPGNKYQTSKVMLMQQEAPSDDGVHVPDKKHE